MNKDVFDLVAANRSLKGTSKLVALALCEWSNAVGQGWPSVPSIAEWCGLQDRVVQYHLKALEREGYLTCDRTRGRGYSNCYTLNLPRLDQEKVQNMHHSEPKGAKIAPLPTEKVQSLQVLPEEKVQNMHLSTPDAPGKGAKYAPKGTYRDRESQEIDHGKEREAAGARELAVAVGRDPPLSSYPSDFVVTKTMLANIREAHPDLDVLGATAKWSSAMKANRTRYKYTDWTEAWYAAMHRAAGWQEQEQSNTAHTPNGRTHNGTNNGAGLVNKRSARIERAVAARRADTAQDYQGPDDGL